MEHDVQRGRVHKGDFNVVTRGAMQLTQPRRADQMLAVLELVEKSRCYSPLCAPRASLPVPGDPGCPGSTRQDHRPTPDGAGQGAGRRSRRARGEQGGHRCPRQARPDGSSRMRAQPDLIRANASRPREAGGREGLHQPRRVVPRSARRRRRSPVTHGPHGRGPPFRLGPDQLSPRWGPNDAVPLQQPGPSGRDPAPQERHRPPATSRTSPPSALSGSRGRLPSTALANRGRPPRALPKPTARSSA